MATEGSPLGVAVIGCGRISFSHIHAIASQPRLGRLVAVVDSDAARARAAAAPYGARALTSLSQALSIDEVEAVDICLPNDMHADAAIEALEAGRHVLMEKPMAENAASALRMAEAAERSGRVLAIGQCRRHFRAMHVFMDRLGDLGEAFSVQVDLAVKWAEPQAPWWCEREKAAGLVIALNGPHALDFVQMVMGELPDRVHAESVRRQDVWSGEDEAMILLAYPRGRLASVRLSFNQQPPVDRKSVLCERGAARFVNDRALWIDERPVVEAAQDEARHYLDGAIEFSRQFAEFVKAARGQPSRSVRHGEGVQLMRVLDAVLEAAASGRVVTP